MAKGNLVAYTPLKPTENKVGDIIASNIDYLIKTGQAEKARKIKELQDRNASLEEFSKSIKIEAKETDKYLTDMNVKLTTDTTILIGNALQNAYNSTNEADKQKWMRIGQNASESYKAIQATFGGTKFLEGVKNARDFANSGEAFDQSKQAKLIQAIENSHIRQQLNADGTISFFAKVGKNINDPEKEFTTGEISLMFQQELPVNKLETTKRGGKGLYDKMREVAPLLIQEYTKNPTGDRKISVKEFVRKKGEIEFDTMFGKDLNVNRSEDDDFGQFSIMTIGKLPSTPEEQAQVKEAFLEKLWSYAPSESLDIAEKSNADKEEQAWRIKNAKKNFYKVDEPSGGNSNSSGSQGFTSISEGMFMMQVKDAKGNVVGFKPQVTSVMPIGENNFVGISQSIDRAKKDKYGKPIVYNSYKIGKVGGNGEIVFSAPINESQFSTYISSKKQNPITTVARLKSQMTTVNKWQPNVYNKVDAKLRNTSPYTSLKIGSSSNSEVEQIQSTDITGTK